MASDPLAIGGRDDAVLPWLYKAVTGSTEAFPTAAREFFADSTLATFTAAYADYLYLRMRAATELLTSLDRRPQQPGSRPTTDN